MTSSDLSLHIINSVDTVEWALEGKGEGEHAFAHSAHIHLVPRAWPAVRVTGGCGVHARPSGRRAALPARVQGVVSCRTSQEAS